MGSGFPKHGGFGRIGFLHKYYTGRYRPSAVCQPRNVDCPEKGESVCFSACVGCGKFRTWDEKDEGLRRCYHEYKDLKSRGFYDGTWDDHPENFDPETFERIQERKRLNEEVNRELEQEFAEYERMAEEIAEDPSYYYDAFDRGEESEKANEEDLEEQEEEEIDQLEEDDEEEDF